MSGRPGERAPAARWPALARALACGLVALLPSSCRRDEPAPACCLVPCSQSSAHVDRGDGTILDARTGLVWETLASDGGLHDMDATYTWVDAESVKLAALNRPPCLADHCDWRLPTRFELESLLDLGRFEPATWPAFDTACSPGCTTRACSCTSPGPYWSSYTYQDVPTYAWGVGFGDGGTVAAGKTDTLHVRAVRGGR